jgi:heptosyltransferase I
MREILFIKTSSLGDVVHHMPAVADARRHLPDARFTWVVEEPYAPLARLHPGIDTVIPVASRRWRSRLHRPETWTEIGRFRKALRAHHYDAVVDTQGLMRTALIGRGARGVRHGYDTASIREPLASFFYDVRHEVEWRCHAIPRNRMLTGRALGYEPTSEIDFGLDRGRIAGAPRDPYALLIHATARPEKEWPQGYWFSAAQALLARGLAVVLPWGSDTGLLHVAAALGVPLVGIFVGSEPGLTGPLGSGPIAVVGGKGVIPDAAEVLRAVDRVIEEAR